MICYLDMDGVLVDFVGGFMRHYNVPNPYDDPKLLGMWDFLQPGICPVDNFDWNNLGYDFWANLEPTHDGFQIWDMAEKTFGPENICILSTPAGIGCMDGKEAWLRKWRPRYVKQYLFGKGKFYASWHGHDVLIDDADHNVKAWKGKSILVPRLWNPLHEHKDAAAYHVATGLKSVVR